MLSGLPLFLQPFGFLPPEEFDCSCSLSGQAILVLWAEDLHLQPFRMELVEAGGLEWVKLQVFAEAVVKVGARAVVKVLIEAVAKAGVEAVAMLVYPLTGVEFGQ